MNKNIELLDGGFLYELNKTQSSVIDYGEHIINSHPELIIKIHKDYIDIGCKYITSGNYVFKPLRQSEWQIYTEKIISLLFGLKKNNNFCLLGCIPPYYESFCEGEYNVDVMIYYTKLKQIIEKYADKYIIETVISYNHLYNICKILDNSLPIIISIYPNTNISTQNLECLIKEFNIEGILINCCNFDRMIYFFNNVISNINTDKKINFGFYLNKIDEKKYIKCKHEQGDDHAIDLTKLHIDDNDDFYKIKEFICNYTFDNKLIIGGCCGYGVEEIKNLKNIINL